MLVFKYYLNTQILKLVFKYILRVFKYLTSAYANHSVKKYALSLITVHILLDSTELSGDQRHISEICVVETKMNEVYLTKSSKRSAEEVFEKWQILNTVHTSTVNTVFKYQPLGYWHQRTDERHNNPPPR